MLLHTTASVLSLYANRLIPRLCSPPIFRSLFWFLILAIVESVPTMGKTHSGYELENSHYRIEYDAKGSLKSILDKENRHALIAPSSIANSFMILVRDASGEEIHSISGNQQTAEFVKVSTEELEIQWHRPLVGPEKRHFDISVCMTIHLTEGEIEFGLNLKNETPLTITEVRYPVISGLGGLQKEDNNDPPRVVLPMPSPWRRDLEFPFGDYELRYPGYLCMSFADIELPGNNWGIYFSSHDTVARHKGYCFSEKEQDETKDIIASVNYYPHVQPGGTFEGPPTVLRFHSGGWREAGKIYREWFTGTFGLQNPDHDWIRQESFFQDTMFLLPEGNINYTFKDIPQWARDARDYGVTSVMISGWHQGGHDNGYPNYKPDPRLGDYEELRTGIEACHDLGMKVYFFVNYQPAMMDSELFRNKLSDLLQCNRSGFPYFTDGWGMGTLASRMTYTTPLMAWLDPSFPEYQDLILKQFLRLVEIGADGLHVDKMFPGAMNFNPRCTMSPDVSPWEGAMQITNRIYTECKRINPSFAMSFENNWDRVLQYGNAVWWGGNMTIVKDVFPELAETVSITQPYDYMGVNNAVREGQVILLGPNNYTRSIGLPSWKQMSRYIKEVKRIRDLCSSTVFLGERLARETVVTSSSSGDFGHSVWRDRETGKLGCVLTSVTPREIEIAEIGDKTNSQFQVHLPFETVRETSLPAVVKLPGQGIAFVMEQ